MLDSFFCDITNADARYKFHFAELIYLPSKYSYEKKHVLLVLDLRVVDEISGQLLYK